MHPFTQAHPRFMTDPELREHFGLSERALNRLKLLPQFPKKDDMVNKTDRKAVDAFLDRRSGLVSALASLPVRDGKENF